MVATTSVDEPRAWVPAGPHIGPDEDDLTLLTGVGDPATDVGGAVLAVHRVGAAACEAAAREPLCDAYTLIEALAKARAGLADPLIDSVSKSLGDPRYAGLLARDLFDDAEQAAMGVFGACISKGVAPPLAIQRAGLVYGVPNHELGNYIAIASDPRAHPIALADAADRAVVRWASAVAREETAEEPVEKRMTSQQFAQAAAEHRIVRGEGGRFSEAAGAPSRPVESARQRWARTRLGQPGPQMGPAVAGEPAPVKAPKEAPKPQRVQRVQRVKRVKRAPQTQRSEPQRPKMKRAQQRRYSDAEMSRVLGRYAQDRPKPRRAAAEAKRDAVEPDFDWDDVSSPMAPIRDGDTYGRIDDRLAWVMSGPESRRLLKMLNEQVADGSGDRVARAGWLQAKLGRANEFRRYKYSDTEPNPHYERLLDEFGPRSAMDFEGNAVRISGEELFDEGIPPDKDAVMEYASRTDVGALNQVLTMDGIPNPLRGEDVDAYPSSDPDNDDWYLVLPPLEESTGTNIEPDPVLLPEAVELVIADFTGELRGNKEETRAGLEYSLDKNQVLRINPHRLRFWDDKQKGFIDRYHGYVASPDDYDPGQGVLKADADRADHWWVARETRDEGGRWAGDPSERLARRIEEVEPIEAPTPAPRVPQRAPRIQRVQRVQRVNRAPLERQEAQRSATQRLQPARASSQRLTPLRPDQQRAWLRAVANAPEPKPVSNAPALLDQPIYKVFSPEAWTTIATGGEEQHPRAFDDGEIELYGERRRLFHEQQYVHPALGHKTRYLDGVNAEQEIRMLTENNVLAQETKGQNSFIQWGETRILRGGDVDAAGWKQLHDEIDRLLATDPTVRIARIEGDVDLGSNEVRIMVNSEPLHPVTLVIGDPDELDPDKPVVLRRVGPFRQSALRRDYDPRDIGIFDVNREVDAELQVYKMVQGDVDLWRAEAGD